MLAGGDIIAGAGRNQDASLHSERQLSLLSTAILRLASIMLRASIMSC